MKRARGRTATWRVMWASTLAALALGAGGASVSRAWNGGAPAGGSGKLTGRATAAVSLPNRAASAQSFDERQAWGDSGEAGLPSGGLAPAKQMMAPGAAGGAVRAHSFGPASETVAPSSAVALRASESPPAVTSAPRPTPAPHFSLGPAPEPVSPPVLPPSTASPAKPAWSEQNVRSVRFDAGYYYGSGRSARQLAEDLTRSWQEKGINLIYFYAYNRVYGARYVTRYPGNVMEDYGRQDLLGQMIRAGHKRGIKVIAWFYGPQHKQMWDAHPDWRQKTADGRDYKPDADSYFLCVRNPQVKEWWEGLIGEVLTKYPELDGVDVAEPQVDLWGDHTCYCEHCRKQFAAEHPGEPMPGTTWRKFRADGMTELLGATIRLAHKYGKEAHVTTVFTAGKDGRLMASRDVRDATGFDLEGVLGAADRPDIVQAELIWQQWAAIYRDQKTFAPTWTAEAVRQAKALVGGRARMVAHLELTDFGCGGLDAEGIGRTVAAAVTAEPYGIDLYDSHLLEKTEGVTEHLQMAWLSY